MALTVQLILFLCIGLFAGFMSGMFGIGGGSVRIPLLNLAGLPLLSAFGINLLVIPFSSSVGAISQRKNIAGKIALRVIIGGAVGSMTGALLAGMVTPMALAVIFVVMSLITVVGMYLDRIAPHLAQRVNPSAKSLVLGAFLLNLITGMRGGSGGSLFHPS